MTGTFACTLKFLVKDCDPQTGEPDEDGYDDEYVVSINPLNSRNFTYFQKKIQSSITIDIYIFFLQDVLLIVFAA